MLEKDIRSMDSALPLYIRLYEHLREYIDSESARQIGKLPTEMELCRIFGVSRNTVTQALSMLDAEKLICRIKHRGTFLTSSVSEFDPQSIRRTIGAVFPAGSAWVEGIEAIREGCRIFGYDFRLYNYDWNDWGEEQRVFQQARKRCGGVILYIGSHGRSWEYLQNVDKNYPLVFFDLYIVGMKCNFVSTNHFLGAYQLAQAVIEKGCRKFCLLEPSRKNSTTRLRSAGFIQALESRNLCYEVIDHEDEHFFERVNTGNFDAVLDPGNTCLHETFDNKMWLGRFDVANATEQALFRTLLVRQNRAALGTNAVTLMKNILRSGTSPERSILLAPDIIEL